MKMELDKALTLLFDLCEAAELSVSLEYDNGKRVPGEFINAPDGEENHVEQGPKGYKVEVGEWGAEQLEPTLIDAVRVAFSILTTEYADRLTK